MTTDNREREIEALKAIVEHAFSLVENSNDYSPEMTELYAMLGTACGKLRGSDPADWSQLSEMLAQEDRNGVMVTTLKWRRSR